LKRSNNSNFLSTISSNYNADNSVEISSENIVDIQSAQKIELCQVKIGGTTDGPNLRHFLAACDQLSAASLPSQSKDKPRTVDLGK